MTPQFSLQGFKQSNPSTLKFHYSNLQRRQELVKKRKQRQLEWMRKLYSIGQNLKEKQLYPELHEKDIQEEEKKMKVGWLDLQKGLGLEEDPMHIPPRNTVALKRNKSSAVSGKKNLSAVESKKAQIDDEEQMIQMLKEIENQELEEKLIGWTKGLDFELYHEQWLHLATTANSESSNLKSDF